MSYTKPSVSGYNTSPPSDDGTVSEDNKIKWSTIKTKITDPVKVYADALGSASETAWNELASTTTDDTTNGFNLVSFPTLTGETSVINNQYTYGDVRRYGATGDGSTDDATAIQNAADSAAATTGSLYFPRPSSSYKIDTNINKPTNGITVITDSDVTFSGSARMFAAYANAAHDYIGTTFAHKAQFVGVADRGYSALSADFTSDKTFTGNGVAGFFAAQSPIDAVGFYWGMNSILELNAGLTGNGISHEIDLDNYSSDYKGQALLINGVGTKKVQYAILAKRADTTSDYKIGVLVENAETGLKVDGENVVSPLGGIVISNYTENLLRLKPLDDLNPTNSAFHLTESTNTTKQFEITKQGGIVVGPGGTEITGHFSAVSTIINFGTLGAHANASTNVTVTGAAVGDTVVATPDGAIAPGCLWQARVSSANTVTLLMHNATTGSENPDGTGADWRFDVWQH